MNDQQTTSLAPRGAIQMRRATDDTVAQMIPAVAAAFGETFTDAEIEHELKTWEVDRIFGAFDGDRTVGMCGIYTFRLTTPGGEVPAAGISLVGVLPGERRRGILTTMMREMIADARARAEPVAVLWASEGAIYQRYGFGLGSFSGSFELTRGRAAFLRGAEPVGRIRLVTEAEALALIPPIYEKVRPGIPGMLSRREAWWQWGTLADTEQGRQASGPKFRVVHEVDGIVDGYAIYRTKAEWDERGPKGTLTVLEVIGTAPSAERELWSWLLAVDLYPTVRGVRQPVPHPLQLALAEPRAMALTATDGIWVRLLDMPVALAARRYGAAGSLVLDVADRFLPENAGRWRITVGADGLASVDATSDSADLALDTADLAACYLGTVRPSELARVDRSQELTPGALAQADLMWRSDRAPWCSTLF